MEVRPGYKQTEVGVIPEEWGALPARDIGAFKGGSGFPLTAQGESVGAYPFFKVSDMNNEGNETFMTTANHYISEPTRKRLGATAFPTGAIVFAKVGAAVFLERKKILGQPSCIDNNMAAFVLDKTRVDVRYMHSLLLSKKLGTLVATTALPALNGKQLGEMVLAVPPLPEQRAIAAALSDVDALLGGLDRLIAKKRDLKQAAMQQLLTGQTRLPGFSGEWEVKRLGDVCRPQKGELITEATATPGEIPVVAGGQEPSYFHNRPNRTGKTITISGSGAYAGFVSFFDFPVFASDCSTISESPRYSIEFLYYQLVLKQGEIYRSQTGGAQPHVHPSDIAPLNFHVPGDVLEQADIAAVLSDMDAELAALEACRDKTRDLKQAMMQELLTGKTRLVKPEAAHA